eukprot:TRINITY_DN1922_c3_g1_i1.p1 TRINITY_DN1922_c3_g1~~TRINITY_DN1922_c3_g1_i1.p1  ORF type:complete len:162 (-),score=4.06 TRINITY_DN1922_c3_g1_i1:192-677(-)
MQARTSYLQRCASVYVHTQTRKHTHWHTAFSCLFQALQAQGYQCAAVHLPCKRADCSPVTRCYQRGILRAERHLHALHDCTSTIIPARLLPCTLARVAHLLRGIGAGFSALSITQTHLKYTFEQEPRCNCYKAHLSRGIGVGLSALSVIHMNLKYALQQPM